MSELDFIYRRHSVRRFKDQDVPLEDIKKLITAAIHAPVGKAKNWHYVVVKNREVIRKIAQSIEKKNASIASRLEDENKKAAFQRAVSHHVFFQTAPVLILAYAGPYPITGLAELEEAKAPNEQINALIGTAPAIQNAAAALENLMLSAAALGYGTCWMTGPNYAASEISELIGFDKDGYILVAMTPLGVPEGKPQSPSRQPVDNYLTVIE